MSHKDRLDQFDSVFNQHLNDAAKRTRKAMARRCPSWLREVKRISRRGGGVMAIFHQPRTRATQRYIDLVTRFVNEDRGEA